MKLQLQKFTEFANRLLPHETAYLLAVQRFQDEDRLAIIKRIDANCHRIDQFEAYDTSIDKRKYNHLQNWIEHALLAIDVDARFAWMNAMEQKIMTDSIQLDEEKDLLKQLRQYEHPAFYFTKFYELVERYRQFLLIRIRYDDFNACDDFLKRFEGAYHRSKTVTNKMLEATKDIVGQYAGSASGSIHWEEWLTEVFYDESNDGLNRYLALVRLIFISFNYGRFDILRDKFDYLDAQFYLGKYYSKRLLLNYYNNRLLYHSHFKEYEKAVYYGYLSIRNKNHDFIHYVNNLCAVLLRLERNEEALDLMKKASPELKNTGNMHSRIGFVSFYLEALNKNKKYKNAESYGDTFLQAYAKEVLQYRWHLFFTFYLEALLHRQEFGKILQTNRYYKLLEKDRAHQNKANYLPTIPCYIDIASYQEGLLSRKKLLEKWSELLQPEAHDQGKTGGLRTLIKQLQAMVPEIINYLPNIRI
ncbi:MAG TPA: hypothetical protein PK066_00090 [Saprospiraceae bacterium]|nr:hypothetical protein [Saprospiraceae bacterium]